MEEDDYFFVPRSGALMSYAGILHKRDEYVKGPSSSKAKPEKWTHSTSSTRQLPNRSETWDQQDRYGPRATNPAESLVTTSRTLWNPHASDLRVSEHSGALSSQYVRSDREGDQTASLVRQHEPETQGVRSHYQIYEQVDQGIGSLYRTHKDDQAGGIDSLHQANDLRASLDKILQRNTVEKEEERVTDREKAWRGYPTSLDEPKLGPPEVSIVVGHVERKLLYIDGFYFRMQPSRTTLTELSEYWSAQAQRLHVLDLAYLTEQNREVYIKEQWYKGEDLRATGEYVLAAISFHKAMTAERDHSRALLMWTNHSRRHDNEVLNVLQALNLRDEGLKDLWLPVKLEVAKDSRAMAES